MKFLIFITALILLGACTMAPSMDPSRTKHHDPAWYNPVPTSYPTEGYVTWEKGKKVWVLGTGRYQNVMPSWVSRSQIRPANYGNSPSK